MRLSLRWQAAAVARSVVNCRAFVERRSMDTRWPQSDVDRERQRIPALLDAQITLERLAYREADPRFADLINELMGDEDVAGLR